MQLATTFKSYISIVHSCGFLRVAAAGVVPSKCQMATQTPWGTYLSLRNSVMLHVTAQMSITCHSQTSAKADCSCMQALQCHAATHCMLLAMAQEESKEKSTIRGNHTRSLLRLQPRAAIKPYISSTPEQNIGKTAMPATTPSKAAQSRV